MRMPLLAFGLNLFPLMATAAPPQAPTTLVIVACRVDDLTDQNRYPMAPKHFRDLEWHVNKSLELECKREEMPVEDLAVIQGAPPLPNDFSNQTHCARAAMHFATEWGLRHSGWWPIAVGCPVPIMSDNGTPGDKSDDFVVAWKLPECPRYMPGTENRMKCRFDASSV
jgi:hypothetical protein